MSEVFQRFPFDLHTILSEHICIFQDRTRLIPDYSPKLGQALSEISLYGQVAYSNKCTWKSNDGLHNCVLLILHTM